MAYALDDSTSVHATVPLPRREPQGVRGRAAHALERLVRTPGLQMARATGGMDGFRRHLALVLQYEFRISDATARDLARRLIHDAPLEVRADGFARWAAKAVADDRRMERLLSEHVEQRHETTSLVRSILRLCDEARAEMEGAPGACSPEEVRAHIEARLAEAGHEGVQVDWKPAPSTRTR